VRARLVAIMLIGAAPLLALLARQIAVDRAAVLAAAHDDLRRIAFTAALRQAELMLEAGPTLRALAAREAAAARTCADLPTGPGELGFTEIGVVPAGPIAACISPRIIPTDIAPLRTALAAAGGGPAVVSLPPVAGRGTPLLVAAQSLPGGGAAPGLVYIVLGPDRLAGLAPPVRGHIEPALSLIDPGTGTVLAGAALPGGQAVALLPPGLRAAAGGGAATTRGVLADVVPVAGTAPDAPRALPGPAQAVMAAVRVADVRAGSGQELAKLLAGALAASAAACALAWGLVHLTQVRPLVTLLRTAGRLGRGEFAARATLAAWDAPEFHLLASRLADMAERVVAAQAHLRESERLHRFLSENSSDLITCIRRDGGFSYVSSASKTLLGYTPEELLDGGFARIGRPQDNAERDTVVRELWSGARDQALLRRWLRHKDGHWVCLEVCYRPVRDPQTGLPTDLVTSARDITATLRAEDALRESEAELRLLAENGTDIIVRLRRDGSVAYASPSQFEILGYAPEELAGREAGHLIDPVDRPARDEALRRLWSGEIDRAALEYSLHHKDGHYVPLEARYRLVRDRQTGEPTDVVLSLRDITERRRAEQALRESEARLRMLAENTTDLIMHLGEDFRRTYASPACLEMYGLTQEEFAQQTDFETYLHPDDLAAVRTEQDRLRHGERTVTMVYRRRHRDGHYVWVQSTTRRVAAGEGFVMVARDITQLKQAEQSLTEQRSFFQALFNHSVDALMVMRVGADGALFAEEINDSMARLIGVPRERALDRPLAELLPGPWYAGALARARSCLAAGGPVTGIADASLTGGRYLEMTHIPLTLPDSGVARVLVSGHDISDAKAAELALAQANSRMALAEQIAGMAHLRVLLPEREIEWSERGCQIIGMNAGDPPLTWEALVARCDAGDASAMRAALAAVLADGTPQTFTARVPQAAGPVRHVQARLVAEDDAAGAHQSVFCALMDVTDHVVTRAALQEARDAAEQAQRVLAELALEDALTGLANRRQFDTSLGEQVRTAAREATPLALALLDVDHFKQFNDLYGHPAGDECLRTVAVAAQSCLKRGGDLAARYGGEEFAVLLPDTDMAGACALAEEIRACIRSLRIPHAGSPHGVVTISAGVAVLPVPHPQAAGGALIRMADNALYEAKSAGRDSVRGHRAALAKV
jgi:diguanylate cyclase (GGDEF)-like protein/PAS domain S-box-containing protein